MLLIRNLPFVACLLTAITFTPGSLTGQELDAFYDPSEIDINWFEPIASGAFDESVANNGWFFSYSRLKAFVSRPQGTLGTATIPSFYATNPPFTASEDSYGTASDSNLDSAWGNRYDLGFNSSDGTGVWLVYRNIENPRNTLVLNHVDQAGNAILNNGQDPIPPTFVTLNGINIYSFEVNRTWDLSSTGGGLGLQPFTGLRYLRVRDHGDRADFISELVPNTEFPAISAPNSTIVLFDRDYFQQQFVTTDNDMLGGQLGLQSCWRRGRWVVSSDVRALVFHNFRNRTRVVRTETSLDPVTAAYDANGILTTITRANIDNEYLAPTQSSFDDESGRFVYGGEFHLNSAFEITRGFALNVGAELTVFGDGIGRGIQRTDDSLVIGGLTFGMSFNR